MTSNKVVSLQLLQQQEMFPFSLRDGHPPIENIFNIVGVSINQTMDGRITSTSLHLASQFNKNHFTVTDEKNNPREIVDYLKSAFSEEKFKDLKINVAGNYIRNGNLSSNFPEVISDDVLKYVKKIKRKNANSTVQPSMMLKAKASDFKFS